MSPVAGPETLPDLARAVGRILVVDDESVNQELMKEVLEDAGHSVDVASDGESALRRVREDPPDVILLDVMMPGMDGFTACSRLKENPATAAIPVLMITSLRDREDRLRGIAAGANDFLSKPADMQDVIMRVRNAVYTRLLHDRVLEDLNRLRELEQMRDTLSHMIVHDIRSSLTAVVWALRMLMREDAERPLTPEQRSRCLASAMSSTGEVLEMAGSVLDVNRLEEGRMPLAIAPHPVRPLIDEAVDSLGVMLRGNPLVIDTGDPSPVVQCDRDIVRRVLLNLLYNAVKYSPSDGTITIEAAAGDECVRVSVTDRGSGIPHEVQDGVFGKYVQVDGDGRRVDGMHSSGLGLTFCKLAVEAHGGTIGVESELGSGSTFWFTLPAPPADRDAQQG
jgi:two-component system, sensor histidine kinase and response regulator